MLAILQFPLSLGDLPHYLKNYIIIWMGFNFTNLRCYITKNFALAAAFK